MHERHSNREQYFKEQYTVTEKYVIPYIQTVVSITSNTVVAEIGCGEAGNLKPFVDMGCIAVGIDLAKNKIENGKIFYASHPNKNNLTLIAEDIYKINPSTLPQFNLIVLRDTIEHIPNQEKFLTQLKNFLAPGGFIFFAFPPWRMPFGGHQQVCTNKFLGKLPYFHLLPLFLYKGILKICGESENKIRELLEVRQTGISIQHFNRILQKNQYQFVKKDLYLVNPNYEIKFGWKPKLLPSFLNIFYFRDFFTTTYYSIVTIKK